MNTWVQTLPPPSPVLPGVGPGTGPQPKIFPSQKIRKPGIPPLVMHFFATIMGRKLRDADVVSSGTGQQRMWT